MKTPITKALTAKLISTGIIIVSLAGCNSGSGNTNPSNIGAQGATANAATTAAQCLSATQSLPATSTWYVSGSISITNKCTTTQNLSGVSLSLDSKTTAGTPVQLGTFHDWWVNNAAYVLTFVQGKGVTQVGTFGTTTNGATPVIKAGQTLVFTGGFNLSGVAFNSSAAASTLVIGGASPTPTPTPTPPPTPSGKIFATYIELDATAGAQAAISAKAYKNYNMVIFAEFGNSDLGPTIPSGYLDMVKTILQDEKPGTINLLSFGGANINPSSYPSATSLAQAEIAQAQAYNKALAAAGISARINGLDLDLENGFSADFISTAAATIKQAGFKVSIAPQIIAANQIEASINGKKVYNTITPDAPQKQIWYSAGGNNNNFYGAISAGNVDYIQAQIYNQGGFTIYNGSTTVAPTAPTALAAYAKVFTNLKGCNDGVSCIPASNIVLVGIASNSAGAGNSVFNGRTYTAGLNSILTDIATAGSNLQGIMMWSANNDCYTSNWMSSGATYACQTSITLGKALGTN
jgi:chitinase